MRIRALKALKDWSKPPARDAITGLARTLPNRDPRTAAVPLKLVLGDMLRKSPEPIVDACLQAMLSLDLREEETMLLDLLIHHSLGDGIQVQIIRMLAEWQSPLLGSALGENACFRGCPQPDGSTPIQPSQRMPSHFSPWT